MKKEGGRWGACVRKKNSYERLEGGGFMSVASDLDWLAWYKLANGPEG